MNYGHILYNDFTFNSWLHKPLDDTFSFRFNIRNQNPKSIPQNILIASWDANIKIDDIWLQQNFNVSFHNDCRLRILNFLIHEYQHFR